ncbi:hypothetical protein TIFTF001_033804 [Ficus carica]|uniref:Plant transposase n=1 Tax=Ficus carica TaxID=3494 RepID=A0AA88J7M9_FICCA|nr:hypothetical protein TIFTF001_033804 [Ficus carica]
MLEKKRRELLLMLGPKCDSFSIEGHSVPHKKNSLHNLAAPVQKDPGSPAKKAKKPIRKMIVREESPEVEPFPTLAQVSKKTQETHPLRDSPATPTKRALHKNSTTGESPEANLPPTQTNQPPTQTNQPPWNNLDESTQVIEDRSANVPMEDPKEFKQKRGPTKMKSLCMDANGRVEIRFNSKGQPIGAGSISLSSFLGPLVREIVPVTIVDWRRVTKGMKEVLWKSVQARFKVDKPWQQDYIFKQMGELWRASKSRLVTKLRDAPNNEERLKLKPDTIKSNVEWKAFVREKTSVEFTSKENAGKVVISRVDAWSRAHKKKNGEPVNALAAEVIEKLEEVEHATPFPSTNVKEDALSRVFGPEKHGQLRGLGKGVSLSKLLFMLERDDHLNSLEEKYGKVLGQLIHMNGLVELLMKNQSSSDKSGSEANAHAPVPMKVNIESSEDKNCEILDWFGSGEVVAKGHWSSSDPKDLVHHVSLGPNAIKVWIHVPIKPDAFLWRPNSEMVCIEDAVGSIVAWPVDKVVLKRNVLEGLFC